MRGKALSKEETPIMDRITPAYAGKRLFQLHGVYLCRDHPRVCGEKQILTYARIGSAGSPPRMRGKVSLEDVLYRDRGITPAYAGKRRVRKEWWSIPEDHPRVCGEKCCLQGPYLRRLGSPPRMRGKASPYTAIAFSCGITPAYAGKSCQVSTYLFAGWDHPRVCGEKFFSVPWSVVLVGSPPRMRGKAPDF